MIRTASKLISHASFFNFDALLCPLAVCFNLQAVSFDMEHVESRPCALDTWCLYRFGVDCHLFLNRFAILRSAHYLLSWAPRYSRYAGRIGDQAMAVVNHFRFITVFIHELRLRQCSSHNFTVQCVLHCSVTQAVPSLIVTIAQCRIKQRPTISPSVCIQILVAFAYLPNATVISNLS
ncbi:hypothetical protein DFH05DRAFT_249327 [Lentinula detonsa]|uniref:Uncharacterized protein n=1 Tax=Lentinula detonsa TaxID=2804962 RepID=A0A9W8NVZ2_9AGAR|nr:hypothetical protein DFH05DRAFT_249327 [Lentinula detonsa]